ncbi:Dos2-interacting transcription regulator of RNA-Pol-II-domain-containing protein [Rhexocercosporidium sp. MPI-PUGE-AT-0058]|nr:Dos2-interacting transcription regulator of RNA-Pol-II-domain-containing protein [Rhexocercosporidium sp. MPI-PUGE-AT-0058]
MPLFTIQDWIGAAHLGGGQAEKEQEIVTDYAGSIELTVYSIENLVKDLAPYIHSDEDLVAVARGLELLSRVLGRLTVEPSRHTAKFISDYLCSRLENTNGLPSFRAGIHEVASCLEVIIRWNHFPPGESITVASAVFSLSKQNRFKDLRPAARQTLYLLVETLIKSRGDALLKSSSIPPLIGGLVGIAEFEKTPICLGVLFQLYTYLSKEWDLEADEFQTLWDSFYRYWPVTVGGSTQPLSKPTSEELREMLLECILSNDSYARNSISMCLEKLDTTHDLSATTKNEVLATLAACIETYSVPAIEPWSIKVWNSLKFEVWNGDIDDFIRASLKVFHALSSKLSQNSHDWTSSESSLALYVLPAASECKERLHDSKKQFMRSTGMILSAIASGSPYAFQLVFKEVLPSMITIWQDLRLGSEKTLLLGVFNNLLVARLALPDISNPEATYPASSTAMLALDTQNMTQLTTDFSKFSQNLVDVYFGAFANSEASAGSSPDPSLSVAAIKGLTLLFQIPGYLSTVEQGMIVQKLNELATSSVQDPEVAQTVVESLQQICSIEPTIFRGNTLLDFLQKLPEKISTDPEKSECELDAILGYLESLTEICCTVICKKEVENVTPVTAASSFWHRNFDAMVEKLLTKFVNVMSIDGQLRYAAALVATIANAIMTFDKTLEGARIATQLPLLNDPTKGPYDYIILALFREIVVQKVDSNGQLFIGLKPSSFDSDLDKLVRMVGRATMLAMRSKLTTPSNNLILSWNHQFPKEPSAIWSLLTHTGDGLLATTQKNLQQGPPDKCLANILSMSLLAGMQPKSKDELRLPAGEVAAAMIHNSLNMPKDSSRASLESTHEMLQLLVNKFGAAKETLGDGTTLLDLMKTLVEESKSASTRQAPKVYQTLAYFTAASLAAFDPSLEPLIGLMIDGIKNPVLGRKVAQSFRILLAPSPILTKENFCAVRLLRNSKSFAVVVNPLITLWQAATDKALKEKYLIAISGILVYMSPTQLNEGIPASRLLPIILEGVAVKDEQFAKTAFMKTLLQLTPRHPAVIEEHLDSVLNRVLDRLRNTYDSPSDCSIECRVLAGDILILLIKLVKPSLLLQRSIKIMTELDSAKDDISGDVRGKVAECRAQWFILSDRAK